MLWEDRDKLPNKQKPADVHKFIFANEYFVKCRSCYFRITDDRHVLYHCWPVLYSTHRHRQVFKQKYGQVWNHWNKNDILSGILASISKSFHVLIVNFYVSFYYCGADFHLGCHIIITVCYLQVFNPWIHLMHFTFSFRVGRYRVCIYICLFCLHTCVWTCIPKAT